jgi:hypothetical protein
MKLPIALLASAGLTAAAFGLQPAAQAAPQQGRACYYTTQATNYQPGENNRTIYVGAGGNRIFRIDLQNECDIRGGDGHLLVEPVGGRICGPLDMRLSVVNDGFRQPCMVRDVVELTPEQAADLPRRYRP